MKLPHRRAFLAEVGQGMMVATIGYGTALELGLTPAMAADVPSRISFGPRESLVALMQETPIERLLPSLADQLRRGTSLRELVAAATLANARAFGGEDYIGFHTFMALAPALHMSEQLPEPMRALPVLKVLYRNTDRIQARGVAQKDTLHPIEAGAETDPTAERIRDAVRNKDLAQAERLLAAAAGRSPQEAYDDLLPVVADGVEVHRTVLAYRAWDLLDLVGREHALTMLRQSLHYCVDSCKPSYNERFASLRDLIPKLLDQYRLVEREPGTRVAEDGWLASMSQTLLTSTPDQAADAIAAALAEGMSADSVADAVALVANQFVLRDPGRSARNAQANKPVGSVHGDSIGVHASDSVNAWRNIARVSNRKNSVVSLMLSGWQVASDRAFVPELTNGQSQPAPEQVEKIKSRDQASLMAQLDDAIRQQDQARACAVVHLYGEQNYPAADVQHLLLRYAISEDGALHAEKYYHTTTEEFARARPAFRWGQLTALARVTASEYGQPAPGMAEAKRLLNV
ncbi:MAG TPA: hypothetical protein VHD36_16445 [Pirellulales bacterium]|nr:hypothetical protein [Pirellulales bacterium]